MFSISSSATRFMRCSRKLSASRLFSSVQQVPNNVGDGEHIQRIAYPGTRLLLFKNNDSTNPINGKFLKEMNKYLTSSETSESVSVVFFSSGNTEVFSSGMHTEDYLSKYNCSHKCLQ